MKTIQKSDLGLDYSNLPAEHRAFMDKNAEMICAVINKAFAGTLSTEEIEDKLKGMSQSLPSNEAYNSLKEECDTLREQLNKFGESVEKLRQKGVDVNPLLEKANESIDLMFGSEKWEQFLAGTTRDARNFSVKGVSMTSDYTGTHLITAQSRDVVSQIKDKQLHIRDLATVLPGDPEMLSFAWQQIYALDRNARYVSENGSLPESTFKVKEATSSVKRVGHHFKLSKRMLKSRVFVRAFVLTQAVQGVLNAEDFGILFGDGSGDNLKGITLYDGCLPVETIVTTGVASIAAGKFVSLDKVANGVKLTLKEPNDVIQEGMKITLVSTATSSQLSGTYDVIKVTDTEILVEKTLTDAQETAEQAKVDELTATIFSGAYHSVESPNSIDALETAVAVMTYAQYRPTHLLLNPITINSIRTEKTTTGDRLKVVQDMGGNPVIAGLKVIPCTDIPVGKYFIGDFNNGCKILEYTGLTLDWADDVDTKLKNQVVLIAQEELILAVENPWAFAYGKISSLKTAITAS